MAGLHLELRIQTLDSCPGYSCLGSSNVVLCCSPKNNPDPKTIPDP